MTPNAQATDSVGLYGSSRSEGSQREAFASGRVPVAVYGLGKMGLPLAAVFAETTGQVVGVDVDDDVVETINGGGCPVENEPGLPDVVRELVEADALTATTDGLAAAERARLHVIIVPTLVTEAGPDLATLEAVLETIGPGIDPGDLVSVESTVPPGTCRDVVAPAIEAAGGPASDEFGVAFCPERTASGRALRDVRGAYPKVVGGIDPESTRAATLVYDELSSNDVYPVSDATTAECVKVFEGVYRDVNIALANELGTLATELGVDVHEAIDVANTQPYCEIHRPGAGVGGHCIPYYPYFLIRPCDTGTPLMRRAREINDAMPGFTVGKLWDALAAHGSDPAEATVGVLGLAYRPGVNETRESPGIAVANRLSSAGFDVFAVDPIVDDPVGDDSLDDVARYSLDDVPSWNADALVLVTPHDAFETLPWDEFEDLVVVDGRDALSAAEIPHPVHTIGDGTPVEAADDDALRGRR